MRHLDGRQLPRRDEGPRLVDGQRREIRRLGAKTRIRSEVSGDDPCQQASPRETVVHHRGTSLAHPRAIASSNGSAASTAYKVRGRSSADATRYQRDQARALFECATPATARELRDHAMIAMLIGCGLRRAELLSLRLSHSSSAKITGLSPI